MPPPGWTTLTVRTATATEIVRAAGRLQAKRGETVSVARMVEEMLALWLRTNGNGDGDLDDGS